MEKEVKMLWGYVEGTFIEWLKKGILCCLFCNSNKMCIVYTSIDSYKKIFCFRILFIFAIILYYGQRQ